MHQNNNINFFSSHSTLRPNADRWGSYIITRVARNERHSFSLLLSGSRHASVMNVGNNNGDDNAGGFYFNLNNTPTNTNTNIGCGLLKLYLYTPLTQTNKNLSHYYNPNTSGNLLMFYAIHTPW